MYHINLSVIFQFFHFSVTIMVKTPTVATQQTNPVNPASTRMLLCCNKQPFTRGLVQEIQWTV